jgi:hypothetical protein
MSLLKPLFVLAIAMLASSCINIGVVRPLDARQEAPLNKPVQSVLIATSYGLHTRAARNPEVLRAYYKRVSGRAEKAFADSGVKTNVALFDDERIDLRDSKEIRDLRPTHVLLIQVESMRTNNQGVLDAQIRSSFLTVDEVASDRGRAHVLTRLSMATFTSMPCMGAVPAEFAWGNCADQAGDHVVARLREHAILK